MPPKTGFYAYPSQPGTLPETIVEAVQQLNSGKLIHVQTWQDCSIGGRLIIREILDKISACDLFLADVTGLNPNVLFELGYAIAAGKSIWLTLDTSVEDTSWREFRLLTTVGYAGYTSHEQIVAGFYKDMAHERPGFLKDIEGSLPGPAQSLLYLKAQHETTTSTKLSARLSQSPIRLITDDPTESPQPLTWYAQQAYRAEAVICHLTEPRKKGAAVRNARCALVSGLALGFQKSLLMLAEGDFLAPLDYRDHLFHYQTAQAALRHTETWLHEREDAWRKLGAGTATFARTLELRAELKSLSLGEHIAENEESGLIHGYFVETQTYSAALEGKHSLFVGRKGAGKSANFIQLSVAWKTDKRNLVCVIKPVAYDMDGLIHLLSYYRDRGAKGFVVECLWKFLLYSEAALALKERLDERDVASLNQRETEFLQWLQERDQLFAGDFSGRLEKCINSLASIRADEGLDSTKSSIGEQLHLTLLGDLRSKLLGAMPPRSRFIFLVDNLDKTWDDSSNLGLTAEFLLGLLTAKDRVKTELGRSAGNGEIQVLMAVFLRADILERVKKVAREPDKIAYHPLLWSDPELLARVVEERYTAHSGAGDGRILWEKYFCHAVAGIETKRYLIEQVIPRPRDLIYMVNLAIATAINRAHGRVEEEDVLEAQKRYSEFAVESFQIENTVDGIDIERVVFEFVGVTAALTSEQVSQCLARAEVPADRRDEVAAFLCRFSFLGFDLGGPELRSPDTDMELRKCQRLAERRGKSVAGFVVHPAFRPFLEITS